MIARGSRSTALLYLFLALALVVSIGIVVDDLVRRPDDSGDTPCVARGQVGIAGGAELVGMPAATLDRELDAMRRMGATWLRVGVDWSLIEADRGRFDWSSTDRVLDAATRRGFRVLGLVLSTPEWARDSRARDSQHALPADPEAFGAFAGLAAQRYRDRITDWEIWNEANIRAFAQPRPDVGVYSAMLQSASRHVRENAGRPVNIVTSGLSPAGDEDGDIAPTTFVRRLYELGGKDAWNSIGSHPYTYPALPEDESSASWNQFLKLDEIRSIIDANDDGHKGIWMTEAGAPTRGEQAVSPDDQAATITQLLGAAATRPGLGPVFIHSSRDRSPDSDDREANFGLLEYDFSHKPAYDAVRAMTGCTEPTR